MIIQISSGQGPVECQLAVSKLFDALKSEFPDIKEINTHYSRFSNQPTSIMFETESDLSQLEGTGDILSPLKSMILKWELPTQCF